MRQTPLDLHPETATSGVRAARIFSNVFSPPSLFALFAFVVALLDSPTWQGFLGGVVYGVLASLAPLLVIVWMLRTGRIADLHVSNTKDRRIPYLVGTVGAVLAFLVVRSWGTLPLLTSFILVNIISMIVLNILNQYWLVSAHVSGITALMLFFGFAYGFWAGLAFFPFVLLTIYVRLYLKRHTTNEIFGGLALGTASVLPVILLGVRTF